MKPKRATAGCPNLKPQTYLTGPRQAPLHSSLKLPSPILHLRHILCLVLNVAATCRVFGRRTARVHYLQPPPQLAFKLSPRLLVLASLQPWCHGIKQRVRLLCCCRPLSVVAFRLARATRRHEGNRAMEQRAIARIMMRCFSMLAFRQCRGAVRSSQAHGQRGYSKRAREDLVKRGKERRLRQHQLGFNF